MHGRMTLKFNTRATLTAFILLNAVSGIPISLAVEAQSGAKFRKCSNYDPRPKCTEAYRNATRKRFGLPTLEKIRQRNGYAGPKSGLPKSELMLTTVAFKTGGGVALVLQRDRKGIPTVEIRQMLRSDRPSGSKPISVKISEASWDMIVATGNTLDPVYAADEVFVCGAIFTVELMDGKGNIRAPVGDSCGNEPRGLFFEAIAEAALAQLPHCSALYPEGYNATLDRLSACFVLSGEQMAAAELFNALESIYFWRLGKADPSEIRSLFADDIIFSWHGIPLIQDAETAAEFWAGDWFYPVDLEYDSFHAETRDRVRVGGSVIIEQSEGEGGMNGRTGPFSTIWQRGADGKFRMQRFEYSGTMVR